MSDGDATRDDGATESRLAALEAKVNALGGTTAAGDPVWNWRIIRIRRTADAIALVALSLSIITIVTQIYQATDRADMVLFAPYQVVIANNNVIKRELVGEPQVIFSAITQYVNRSSSGHVGLVQEEMLEVGVKLPDGAKNFQFFQYQIVRSHSNQGTTSQTPDITLDYANDPGAFVVSQQAPVSHEVLFIPFGQPKCLPGDKTCETLQAAYPWADLEADMDKIAPDAPMPLTFTVAALTYGKPMRFSEYQQYIERSPSCTVTLSPSDRNILRNTGWVAPECF
jgi:hypothetical protein